MTALTLATAGTELGIWDLLAELRAGPRADTAAGQAMVAAAERYAADVARGALAHDRDGAFATEHLERLRDDGFLFAPLPVAFEGDGVEGVHDVLVAMSRLARGDAATSIGVIMHSAVLLDLVRRWHVAIARDEQRRAESLRGAEAWRDARAAAFMHPLRANRADEFLARTALGLEPRQQRSVGT